MESKFKNGKTSSAKSKRLKMDYGKSKYKIRNKNLNLI